MLLGRLTQKFLQVQEDNQIRKSINISVLTHVKKNKKKRYKRTIMFISHNKKKPWKWRDKPRQNETDPEGGGWGKSR